MRLIFEIIFIIFSAAAALMTGYKMFQIYQLSGYKTKPVLSWIKNTRGDYIIRYAALGFISFISMFVYISCFSKLENAVYYLGGLFFLFFSAVFVAVTVKEQKKTPLKITPRVLRCAALTCILAAAMGFGLIKVGALIPADYSLMGLGLFLAPYIVIFSHLIMTPFEKLNNNRYKKRAAAVLESRSGLIKIGITGSFGKTTAKNILAKMLEKKYKVAYSPSSFNTPMGLSSYINNSLSPDAEVFIAEMGARYQGDIAELAEFIKPSYALITSIGCQHLETFGSLENIVKTKYELIEGMEKSGAAFFSNSNKEILGMYEKCPVTKYLTGEAADGDETALSASYSDLALSARGTSFSLEIGGKEIKIETRLLGHHIASLIALCAQCAYCLGVDPDAIKAACAEIEPVHHRLQLIERGDTVIIDDAYNSNSSGAANALEILSKFEGTRIIITPGLVEMGKAEEAANSELGAQIPSKADIAYLIGARAKHIKAGALKAGMKEENIYIFESLNQSMEKLKEIEGKKAVLFENDLPDNY